MTSSPNPEQILRQQFHLDTFRPGQQEAIERLLAGESALVVFPTGGGKSLCYQLPAVMCEGLTLVISPLIALMQDQVDALQHLHVAAERLDSTRSAEEVRKIYRRLREGRLKLLYIAPERLQSERFVAAMRGVQISLMAVDEAHCISEWGHNFRPDYLKLATLAKDLKINKILGLTATATPEVSQDICRQFNIPHANHIQTGFYRSNLQLRVTACEHHMRLPYLQEQIGQSSNEPTIVYVTLQKTAEYLAQQLTTGGVRAIAYHAGLKNETRESVQNAFMCGDVDIIVATIAFGMGIDKANVRAIYHYNFPKSLENYMQEIGRAGRDGVPSRCELLVCPDDLRVLENFSYGDTPIAEHLSGLVHHLLEQGETFDISVYELANEFDIRPLVVNTALTYLELAGAIRATGPFYATYQVQFLEPLASIVNRFNSSRGEFLQRLFAQGKQGSRWLNVDLNEAAQTINEPRERLIKALKYIEEQGWIATQVKGIRQGYRRQQNLQIESLTAHLNQLFARREQQDLKRINTVMTYSQTPRCLPQQLCGYFGEQLKHGCGQCTYCQQKHAIAVPRQHEPEFTEQDIKTIQSLVATNEPALRHPRQLTRFLCGLSSPATTRARLKQAPTFGMLSEYPFHEVLNQVTDLLL